MKLLPKVFRTEKEITEFDPLKIQNSLIKETGLSEDIAKKITEKTIRRIVSSGIRFLSGPHIREIVCSILSENNYEEQRKLYTRIGMPLMDYEELFQSKFLSQKYDLINPEVIRHIAVNQLAEEYALLRLLNDAEAKSHLSGDIHIHKLEFFDSSPMVEIWDPRLVLTHGILYGSKHRKIIESGNSLKTFFRILLTWLNLTRYEVSTCLGYLFLPTFLAPLVKNLKDEIIEQEVYIFLKEIDLLRTLSGPNNQEFILIFSLDILQELTYNKVLTLIKNPSDVYGDFKCEHLRILVKFLEGIDHLYSKEHYYIPKIYILFDEKSIKDLPQEVVNLINNPNLLPHLYFINYKDDSKWNILDHFSWKERFWLNFGVVQHTSINLPRIAYQSSNRNSFLYILKNQLKTVCEIHIKRKEILENRLKSGFLPFCATKYNNKAIYDLENKIYSIGLIGFKEAVEILTKIDEFKDKKVNELEKQVLEFIFNTINLFSTKKNMKINSFCFDTNIDARRFLNLDKTHFSDIVPSISNQDLRKYSKMVFQANVNDLNNPDKIKSFNTNLTFLNFGSCLEIMLKKEYNNLIDLLQNLTVNTRAKVFKFKINKKK